MNKTCIRSALTASTLALSAFAALAPASAADLGSEPDAASVTARSPWSFRFTTYSWVTWLTGDMTVAGRGFDVDVSPKEILEHLDWSTLPAWMSYAEARYGRLSLFNDIVYAKLTGSDDFAKSKGRGRLDLTVNADIEVDYEQATIEAGAAYEVAKWWHHQGSTYTALDVLAGARYWRQDVRVSADITAALDIGGLTVSGGRVIAKSGSVDWVDPFVGARLRHQLWPGTEFVLRGDVGGFDAGSEFSWQLIGTYSWLLCITDHVTIDGYFGYRALAVDYKQGSGRREYEYDVLQHGPVTGLTFRF